MEDTAERGEKDTTADTIGADGERSCTGSVGEQYRVTSEHPSNPWGASGPPSRSRSLRAKLTAAVRPETELGHTPLDRAEERGGGACARRRRWTGRGQAPAGRA